MQIKGSILNCMDPLSIYTADESDKFQQCFITLYEVLNQYLKDFKNPNSWIAYYSELLNIKFPSFTFNEGYHVFLEKLTKILDLMELSHLYCKITTPEKYNKNNHKSVTESKEYFELELGKMTVFEFEEIRKYLRNSILYGNN